MRRRIIEFDYMNRNTICSHVVADYETGEVRVQDFSNDTINMFFGKREHSIEVMEALWEERCFPRTRYNAKELLNSMDLQFYDAYQIIRRTHGVLPEDYYWIRFSDEKGLHWDDVKIKNWRLD